MELAHEIWRNNYVLPYPTKLQQSSLNDLYSRGHKRVQLSNEGNGRSAARFIKDLLEEPKRKQQKKSLRVVDYSDPFAVPDLLKDLDCGKYGSVTADIEALCARRMAMLTELCATYSTLCPTIGSGGSKDGAELANQSIIDLEDGFLEKNARTVSLPVVIIDSDDECDQKLHTTQFQEIYLGNSVSGPLMNNSAMIMYAQRTALLEQKLFVDNEIETTRNKGEYVGVEDDADMDESKHPVEDDGMEGLWKEMSFGLECSKDIPPDTTAATDELIKETGADCDHSFMLKDDIGYVCRVCGVIDKAIETIVDYQYSKSTRTLRTYIYEPRSSKDGERSESSFDGLKLSEHDFAVTEISAHPRHMKQMKPHQVEGFNFLLSNLVTDNPRGCILAHAPGSGKTFMIISFMQSFLTKYPHARPLVVLPKGILATWRKEFQRWQVEDIPLYDFYTLKAESRSQQLHVLKKWVDDRSILFLGYKQFSSIICGAQSSSEASACQEILLKVPTILILDEGHTPRNENTDVLHSLAKIQTPRKVVLSGTLYQNHVKEVFNILKLVCPRFMKLDTSRAVRRRIFSKVQISGVRKQVKSGAEAAFYDLVEHTLQKDEDFKRKTAVIQDLREMTSKVLHYYKGDFLEELPGLVDFTVLLNLGPKQKSEVEKLKKFQRKFKRSSVGSAVYLHPQLKPFAEMTSATPNQKKEISNAVADKLDELLEGLNVRDGVKAKFFLNMLGLCESAQEKLLVFSHYLLPLKFLEKLAAKKKGWSPGREIFMISGDSSPEHREWAMDHFNNSRDAKVFFGSIKACGEGISLVGASRILILDVHLNPSVTRQAIGRAFRPGQQRKVFTYRLVAADSPEDEDHTTCFRKELIAKMWFEWNQYCGQQEFDVERVDVSDCDDLFLESPMLHEDVKALYRRFTAFVLTLDALP
ncbi:SNF2, N-terminal, partial [Dillenia turbinata]